MKPTQEQLDDIRRDAEFTRDRVGAPGCKMRQRAAATIVVLDELEKLRAKLHAWSCNRVVYDLNPPHDAFVCRKRLGHTDAHADNESGAAWTDIEHFDGEGRG